MKNLKILTKKLENTRIENQAKIQVIQNEIQKILDVQFKKDKYIQKQVKDLENSNKYTMNELGDVEQWLGFELPEKFKTFEDYFSTWLNDQGYYYDSKNDCLLCSHGDDNIMIQAEHGRDNGVWQGHKIIIKESEYKNEENEVDEKLRNELIEKHMEKTGHFPGVFRVTYHGDIYPVNTKEEL